MSQVFFDELSIPQPDINLAIGSGGHGRQTGEMLIRLEEVLLAEKPDRVLVYGDTNSTLAGALAAVKLRIPVAHVEAGLRSFNRAMPEEHNRVLTDHVADLLFCPTQTAVDQLRAEGITRACIWSATPCTTRCFSSPGWPRGNVRRSWRGWACSRRVICWRPCIGPTTRMSREPAQHPGGVRGDRGAGHLPRASAHAQEDRELGLAAGAGPTANPRMIEPVGYLDMLALQQNARLILTDSGGIQKEAYWLGVPCITLRTETEWVETVEAGWNVVVGADRRRIAEMVKSFVAGAMSGGLRRWASCRSDSWHFGAI